MTVNELIDKLQKWVDLGSGEREVCVEPWSSGDRVYHKIVGTSRHSAYIDDKDKMVLIGIDSIANPIEITRKA